MLVVATFFAGRISVQRELERLRTAQRKAIRECLEERLAREETYGRLQMAQENLKAAYGGNDGLATVITRLRNELARQQCAQVELVAAAGINDAADLVVTEFTVPRTRRAGATYLKPESRSLKTKQASILLMQEAGWTKVTIDEARGMIHESTPVVITYKDHDRPYYDQSRGLWNETGPPPQDSEAVWRVFSRILRPEILVFVLSARENASQP